MVICLALTSMLGFRFLRQQPRTGCGFDAVLGELNAAIGLGSGASDANA
jgi:hypothetical protein